MRIIPYKEIQEIEKTSSKGNQGKYHTGNEWIKTDYLGYEAASEYLCSELLKQSNVDNFVQYTIENVQIEFEKNRRRTKISCISENFLPENTEIVTLDKLIKQFCGKPYDKLVSGKSVKETIEMIVNIIEQNTGIKNYGQYITKMLEFDALTLNEDRHIQNIIFLKKDNSYEPGPIFDNGASFLSDITQEYPLEDKTPKLISYVKAKPFSSSFIKQVEACHELYGKQLEITNQNIDKQIAVIKSFYGDRIANRIQHIYNIQIIKNKDLLQIKQQPIIEEYEDDPLYTEKEMIEELKTHLEGGGHIISSIISEQYIEDIKKELLDEEIPYAIVKNKDEITIFAKDIDQKDFLKVLTHIYSVSKTKNQASYQKVTSKTADKMLQIADYDDI